MEPITLPFTSKLGAPLISQFLSSPFLVFTLLQEKKTVIAEEVEMVNGIILERSYIPIFNEGIYKGHLWSYEDVTIPKRYKESLQAQKEKYSNIIANMNLGLVEVDNDDRVIMANIFSRSILVSTISSGWVISFT